mmetsp:Transcript_59465/g.81246  ORF Transcript_59465/g.81246 Transcript_59465/m.81246 type:complete len:210 (-) Transcript_59465:523-1152(-)
MDNSVVVSNGRLCLKPQFLPATASKPTKRLTGLRVLLLVVSFVLGAQNRRSKVDPAQRIRIKLDLIHVVMILMLPLVSAVSVDGLGGYRGFAQYIHSPSFERLRDHRLDRVGTGVRSDTYNCLVPVLCPKQPFSFFPGKFLRQRSLGCRCFFLSFHFSGLGFSLKPKGFFRPCRQQGYRFLLSGLQSGLLFVVDVIQHGHVRKSAHELG